MRHRHRSNFMRHDDRLNIAWIFFGRLRHRFDQRPVIGAGIGKHVAHRTKRFHLRQESFSPAGNRNTGRGFLSHKEFLSRKLVRVSERPPNCVKNRLVFQHEISRPAAQRATTRIVVYRSNVVVYGTRYKGSQISVAASKSIVKRRPKFTDLQGQYLAFIQTYTTLHGVAPAEADMQRFFRVTPPTVHRMVLALEQRGLLERVPGRRRSTRLLLPSNEIPKLERRGNDA